MNPFRKDDLVRVTKPYNYGASKGTLLRVLYVSNDRNVICAQVYRASRYNRERGTHYVSSFGRRYLIDRIELVARGVMNISDFVFVHGEAVLRESV